jgi:hypothetical protein
LDLALEGGFGFGFGMVREREECNWMCSFDHPYYGCISFVNIHRVKFTKKGVPFG